MPADRLGGQWPFVVAAVVGCGDGFGPARSARVRKTACDADHLSRWAICIKRSDDDDWVFTALRPARLGDDISKENTAHLGPPAPPALSAIAQPALLAPGAMHEIDTMYDNVTQIEHCDTLLKVTPCMIHCDTL